MKETLHIDSEITKNETIKIKVDRTTGEFEMFDYKFKLETIVHDFSDVGLGEMTTFKVTSPDWKESVCEGFLEENGSSTIYDHCNNDGSFGISRHDQDAYMAAAKLLAVTI